MTDYLENGYQYASALIGPTNAQGIFFMEDGTLKIVSSPFTSAQVEAISISTTGVTTWYNGPTAVSANFTVAATYAVTIAGTTAATNYLTITAGSMLLSSGNITLSAGTLSVTDAAVSTGTTNVIASIATLTAATATAARAVYGSLTTFTTFTAGTVVGVRGLVTLGGSVAAGTYIYGTQGKLVTGANTVVGTTGYFAGVMAQVDASGSTLTSGNIAGLVVEIIGPSGSAAFVDGIDVFAGGSAINSVLRAWTNATYFVDLSEQSVTGTMCKATNTSITAIGTKGYIAVKVAGVVRYIGLSETVVA